MRKKSIRGWSLLIVGIALVTSSCSGDGYRFAEVEGIVTMNGKPLADVEVVFMPDAAAGTQGPSAACYTNAEGRYVLWCERAQIRGAIVGTHRVCVHDIAAIPAPPESIPDPREGPNGYRPRPPRVPQQYADVAQTPFRDVVVNAGSQTINFDVKGRRP